jgi:3-phenylpropionate/trans-cinnamate dioxygenase ferredoxin reductase component
MVIVGAGMAGARACQKLRDLGHGGPIVLVGAEELLPYDRPPLSKQSLLAEETPAPVWLLQDDAATALDVDMRIGVSATAIDPATRTVALSSGETLTYDKLLLATGAKPRLLTQPGGEHALVLRNHADMLALRARFLPGKRIVIVGGGFIGLELAASAVAKGCLVCVVEAQPRILMRGVPEALARILHDEHVARGVEMLVNTRIERLTPTSVVLESGRVLAADCIVAGIGAAPDTTLAAAAGLAVENGIACNGRMQTSDPHIFAAGDCASYLYAGFANRRIRLEAWRSAGEQAETAAANMLGQGVDHRAVPWFWSDQYDLGLQIVGLAELAAETVTRVAGPRAHMQFHLADNGRLVGAAAIAEGNAAARDIKLAEIMIAKGVAPPPAILADVGQSLKPLIKG